MRDLQQLEIFVKNLRLVVWYSDLLCGVVLIMLVLDHGCCGPCVAVQCRGWHKALSTFQSYVLLP